VSTDDTCYKCQQSGHMARDCTEEPVEGAPRRGGGDGTCYKCKETGHMARDCTNAPAEMEPGPDGKPRERYIPPEMLEGDDAFKDRNETHSGSGINFNQYDSIPVNVSQYFVYLEFPVQRIRIYSNKNYR